MELAVHEQVAPFALTRTAVLDAKVRAAGQSPKCIQRFDEGDGKSSDRVVIDSETPLAGIPPEAWCCRLGNRCALEWVLDPYQKKKPKDPAIHEKFDLDRFADHTEKVIGLLMRAATVSVETVWIVAAKRALKRP